MPTIVVLSVLSPEPRVSPSISSSLSHIIPTFSFVGLFLSNYPLLALALAPAPAFVPTPTPIPIPTSISCLIQVFTRPRCVSGCSKETRFQRGFISAQSEFRSVLWVSSVL